MDQLELTVRVLDKLDRKELEEIWDALNEVCLTIQNTIHVAAEQLLNALFDDNREHGGETMPEEKKHVVDEVDDEEEIEDLDDEEEFDDEDEEEE